MHRPVNGSHLRVVPAPSSAPKASAAYQQILDEEARRARDARDRYEAEMTVRRRRRKWRARAARVAAVALVVLGVAYLLEVLP